MVKYQQDLDRVFSALADPTRRQILTRLSQGQRTVGELAESFDISPSGFSKHLRVLEGARLLRQHKRGRKRYCEALNQPLGEAAGWLEAHLRVWSASMDQFARYAEGLQSERDRRRKQ